MYTFQFIRLHISLYNVLPEEFCRCLLLKQVVYKDVSMTSLFITKHGKESHTHLSVLCYVKGVAIPN